jgi:hypothetical protein
VDAVATALVSPEYVYLLRVVDCVHGLAPPSANIPIVEFPEADPFVDPALEDVADERVQLEYVYLFRVFVAMQEQAQLTVPKANIPTLEFPVAEPYLAAHDSVAEETALVQLE